MISDFQLVFFLDCVPQPPPRRPLTNAQAAANESDEDRQFRKVFQQLAGDGIYKNYDADRSGMIGADELPAAFRAAGFPLNDQLFQMIIRRYSDENGNMDFDNYIGCLVRLDAMCRAFKTLDKNNSGVVKVNIKEV
ncbi:Calpain small subunit 1 [Bagarius yarrelli]|uniref:Calpain small subunit 1 n=1 Tax=Bagarius yarrelli TaxID=175774 RepID=A0A556U6S9_BAGYA|nr:Calpain small subunit 1 [Bagarius yarrelli]